MRKVTMLRADLFGGFILAWDDDPLPPIRGTAARSLFAYLVTYRHHPHTHSLLAGTFWPDIPEPIARRRLNRALYEIRRALRAPAGHDAHQVEPHRHRRRSQAPGRTRTRAACDVLVTEGDTAQLNPGFALWLDVEAFTRHNDARAGAVETIEACELGLALYQGAFMAGYYAVFCHG